MKAIVWTAYGPPYVLKLQEVPKPAPKDNEVLIKIHAATVTAGDCEMRSLKFPLYLSLLMRFAAGLREPERVTILGTELSGEIESVGKNVRRFKKGDHVFGSAGFEKGTYAEYVCLPEESEDGVLATKPVNLSYEEAAAAVVGGLESLHFLGQANIQGGQRILINGAGGTIGTAAIQFARHYGGEVTAVDSTKKLDMMRSIGADHVIDYTQEDFTKSGETYDVVFDVVGKASFSGCMQLLKEGGSLLLANPKLAQMVRGRWASKMSSKKVVIGTTPYTIQGLDWLRELIEAGKMKPVIDSRYRLEQVPEAHRYVERGGKKGNVVITVDHSNG